MSVKDFKDQIHVITTSTGIGALIQSGVVTGFAAPVAGDDGKTFSINIYAVDSNGVPTGVWEVCESIYTHSGTSWSRGTLLDSSTGLRINFTTGTKRIAVVVPADVLNQLAYLLGKSGGQILIGGTGASDLLTLAADTTANSNGDYITIDNGLINIYLGATRQVALNATAIFNRSVEVGTDPLGALPGNAGKFKAWTDDDGVGEPSAGTNFCIFYAWDYAAGDARWKLKSETGTAIIIGNGQVIADAFVGGTHTASYTFTPTSGTNPANAFTASSVPASNSTAENRNFVLSTLIAAAAGVTQTTIIGIRNEIVHRQTGAVGATYAENMVAVQYDGSSPATPGTITTGYGINLLPYARTSGTSAGTVTNLVGFNIQPISDAGLTSTTIIGYRMQSPSAGTITNLIGIDIEKLDRGTTLTSGIRIAFPGIANGIGATTDLIGLNFPNATVTVGNQTATTSNAFGIFIGVPTYTSTTLVRTLTNAASLYIGGAPVASTNVTIATPWAIYVNAGNTRLGGNLTVTGTTTLTTSLTGVLRADSGVIGTDSDVTDIVSAASDTLAGKIEVADQAEMETGTDTTRAVSPGRQHFHPGHPKMWGKATVSGGVPTLSVSYNITSITDSGVGILTVTLANDFSGANWCCSVQCERTATTGGVANDRKAEIRSASLAAGTFSIDCWDSTATTNALVDPTSWHWLGLGDLP